MNNPVGRCGRSSTTRAAARRRSVPAAVALAGAVLAAVAWPALPAVGETGPQIDANHAEHFQLTRISNELDVGGITQMTWGPDGGLYATTHTEGVWRYDYDPVTGLSNQTLAVHPDNLSGAGGALGIAFHGEVMYLSHWLGFSGSNPVDEAGLTMLTDGDGDGQWGAGPNDINVEIVNNVPLQHHHVDQIQIRDNRLYVGIGARSDLGTGDPPENSYTSNITWIQDLAAVESAVFADPDNAENIAGFDHLFGDDFFTDPTPFTSTDPTKLIVHSTGTRNPYGLAFDGDGNLWMTNNERDSYPPDEERHADTTPQDALFKTQEFGDYGFPQEPWRDHPDAVAAGFFLEENRVHPITVDEPVEGYDPANPTPDDPPGGLGPASSANGFDFYMANDLPLEYHKHAFITRFQANPGGGRLGLLYGDVAAVNPFTGEVLRIAHGFDDTDGPRAPLDILADEHGNLLVTAFFNDQSVWLISPTQTRTEPHDFTWDEDAGGNWSDRLAWNHHMDERNRLVPHEWGTARYAVTIAPGDPSHTITLDQDARIDSLALAARLVVAEGRVLEVVTPGGPGEVNVQSAGELAGSGEVRGNVHNAGVVSPGQSIGTLTIAGNYTQDADGTLVIQLLSAAAYDQLIVEGVASLAGTLEVELLEGFSPQFGDVFDLFAFGSVDVEQNEFDVLTLPALDPGLAWQTTALYDDGTLAVVPEPGSAALAGAGLLVLLYRRSRRQHPAEA